MKIIEKAQLNLSGLKQLMQLWNAEYPDQIRYQKIDELEQYLKGIDPDKHYLIKNGDEICAWMVLFQREGATWFAMIVDKDFQGMGMGNRLLQHAKGLSSELNGWAIDEDHYKKSDGSQYRSPVGFYLKNDFVLCPEIRMKKENFSAVKIFWKAG